MVQVDGNFTKAVFPAAPQNDMEDTVVFIAMSISVVINVITGDRNIVYI